MMMGISKNPGEIDHCAKHFQKIVSAKLLQQRYLTSLEGMTGIGNTS